MAGNRGRITFRATVPPLGHRVYHLVHGAERAGDGPVPATGTSLENEYLRIEVDPATGWLAPCSTRRPAPS